MYCKFSSSTKGSQCLNCQYELKRDYDKPPTRQCRSAAGLGDYTEYVLSALGITKERYAEAKEMFGFAPTCDCDGRQEWLNKVGRYFGIGS